MNNNKKRYSQGKKGNDKRGYKPNQKAKANWGSPAKQDAALDNYQDAAEKREYEKGKRAGEKFAHDIVHVGNDPSWYFKDPKILSDVASFSFNKPLGTNLNVPVYNSGNSTSGYLATVPGVMSIHIGLSSGVSTDAQSPINLAATNVYAFVRYKNSGAANYDAPDLMLYLIAMDSVYACWNWMKRLYGLASTYSQRNKYEPRALVAANGVDYDDLIANLADFRAYLNMAANRISAFCVPATMTYNVRHSWLFSNVFKDGDTGKAQEYMYVPSYFYTYDETSSPQGGFLDLKPILVAFNPESASQTYYKVSDLENILNTMINNLQYSEDAGIMSGDILKAYGPSNLFTLSTFDADYRVDPAYSKEVLSQIENARPVFMTSTDYTSMKIVQNPDTNFINHTPIVSGKNGNYHGQYLNFHWENPTPEDVVRATRLNVLHSRLLAVKQLF